MVRNDKWMVRTAVEHDGRSLQRASAKLRNDKEVVAAAKKNGGALQDASGRLQRDKAAELQNDKEFRLAAVKQKGYLRRGTAARIGRFAEGQGGGAGGMLSIIVK